VAGDALYYSKKIGTTVDKSIERRNFRRFQVALPVLLRWADGEGHVDIGHCVNIGHGGMFVLAGNSPPFEIEVEVEFVLPPSKFVPRPIRLRCIGRVIRAERCYGFKGFAVAGRFVNESKVEF
jgi:PilZ domain